MLIKTVRPIASSEITPPQVYGARRRFLGDAGRLALAAALGGWTRTGLQSAETPTGKPLDYRRPGPFGTDEAQTPFEDVSQYCNFVELGSGKTRPAMNAHLLKTDPWRVRIHGEVDKPGDFTLEDILKPHTLEERIYRLRCVETWAMVVPWVGFPLGDLLRRFQPTSKAKYVHFTTLLDRENLPGQQRPVLDWPYEEGLRIDEAMHPLTILAVGLYGVALPNQNGAPLRLVVPWKYGFKSIKSIVGIRLQERRPVSTWTKEVPDEYGFYANVNPAVDHPRWSQKSHRVIGAGLFAPKRPTQPFNGYAEQVAGLYAGLDLQRNF